MSERIHDDVERALEAFGGIRFSYHTFGRFTIHPRLWVTTEKNPPPLELPPIALAPSDDDATDRNVAMPRFELNALPVGGSEAPADLPPRRAEAPPRSAEPQVQPAPEAERPAPPPAPTGEDVFFPESDQAPTPEPELPAAAAFPTGEEAHFPEPAAPPPVAAAAPPDQVEPQEAPTPEPGPLAAAPLPAGEEMFFPEPAVSPPVAAAPEPPPPIVAETVAPTPETVTLPVPPVEPAGLAARETWGERRAAPPAVSLVGAGPPPSDLLTLAALSNAWHAAPPAEAAAVSPSPPTPPAPQPAADMNIFQLVWGSAGASAATGAGDAPAAPTPNASPPGPGGVARDAPLPSEKDLFRRI